MLMSYQDRRLSCFINIQNLLIKIYHLVWQNSPFTSLWQQKLPCPRWGSNSRPSDYETDALPTALRRLHVKPRLAKDLGWFLPIFGIDESIMIIRHNNDFCKVNKRCQCVSRESNPGQLLGRQLCSPLYHWRLHMVLDHGGSCSQHRPGPKVKKGGERSERRRQQTKERRREKEEKRVTAVTRIRTWVTAATTQGPNH